MRETKKTVQDEEVNSDQEDIDYDKIAKDNRYDDEMGGDEVEIEQ